ncbi:ArsR family transcriptional regulator [Haloarchaeobius sp. HRN-SO-5]|uniref:ArsR family transcriptional regulator n=1 Tax=Haloarchaeobius sp. HRN-SO-5 TaxID=3446118 RepID=UPI003EB937AF
MTRITNPTVADLSPAPKLVYLVLAQAGPCSVSDLRGRTQLADRTIRRALERLRDVGVVETRPHPHDQRMVEYQVVE